jgi:phospholipid/cholesterol/gamma-HCH transport system ATP-binding protein
MIRIKSLSKSFNGRSVLKNLDLTIHEGETLVIVGKSGSGKSVLLKHMIGLLKPDSGSVFINDIDITLLQDRDLYSALREVGMVFQGGALFDSLSIFDNVAFYFNEHKADNTGKKYNNEQIKHDVLDILKKVGLEGTEKFLPSELSGGMRKRAALARGVVYKPNYIFYDEPTTGLDPVTSEQISNLILKMQEDLTDATSIVVTHDIPSALMIADKMALIEDGVIEVLEEPLKFMKTDHPTINYFNKIIGKDYSLIKKGKKS